MEVKVAQTCGFCRGVKNAIKTADDTLAKEGAVYCLGQIIHNKDVVERLRQKGLMCVDSVEQVSYGTVLIRSHGATKTEFEEICKKGLCVVDATCQLVKKVQKIAKDLNDEGYSVIMIGDKDHPEVKAIVGWADDVIVAGSQEDLNNINISRKCGIICQTTQSPEHFADMVAAIVRKNFGELKIVNTLCQETRKRQDCSVELCKEVEVMFVLGGLNSANTRKLADLCRKYNSNTYHIQNFSELDKSWLKGKKTAGVTAGASTPDWVIQEFVEQVSKF